MGTLLLLVLVMGITSITGCRNSSAPPNIILITIDTLRADRLSCYGYHRNTTPRIDGLAEDSTIFRRATATSSWTSPSMASIFTSKYPRSHGIRSGHVDSKAGRILQQEFLSRKLPVLPELFQQNGYTTFGVSTNAHMTTETGFDRGFDYFESYWFEKAETVNNTVNLWRRQIDEADRYFLWVHYFDPHDPYLAQEPWIREYNPVETAYLGWAGSRMKRLRRYQDRITGNEQAIKALNDLYDSEINYTDEFVGKLLDNLPVDQNTAIVIVADHGEGFLDHGILGHGETVFEELIHVPLIIKLPKNRNSVKSIDQRVSINDIFPTLCAAAGITPPGGLQGENLVPLMTGEAAESERAVLSEVHRPSRKIFEKAVLAHRWKTVFSGSEYDTVRLFDLQADPHEKEDVSAANADQVVEMTGILDQFVQDNPIFVAPVQTNEMSDEQRQELEALGYLY